MEESKFEVCTWTAFEKDSPTYFHWSEGLNMLIKKDGVSIILSEDEIQQLVKSLPRTFGGTY